MTELMMLLMVWINGATGLPIVPPPNVQFVETAREMFRLAYECDKRPEDRMSNDPIPDWYCDRADDDSYEGNILALYDHTSKTIILKKQWNRKTIKNRAVLIHELVHHMQWEAGRGDDKRCRGDVEKEAYETQNKWLKEFHDTDIFVVLGLGRLYYMTIISCQMMNSSTIDRPEYDIDNVELASQGIRRLVFSSGCACYSQRGYR